MYFVSGITGQVGGATADHLLLAGHKVRALVRDPDKARAWALRGVDVCAGDFNDTHAVSAALEGVEGAFLMLPPVLAPGHDFPAARAILGSFRAALNEAPPKRLVALSSIGAQRSNGLGLITTSQLMESSLADLPFPTAFIRAGSFLENYTFGLVAAASTGWFDTFRTPTSRSVPMIATADIGQEVARRLTSHWRDRKIVELGSPFSPDDLAHAMAQVLGRPVQARAIPRDRWSSALEAQGMRSGTTDAFEEMEDGFNAGWIDFGVAGTEPVAGTRLPVDVFRQAWNRLSSGSNEAGT